MKKVSDKVVIDADVARSSGETDHPVSSNCRNLLESVRKNKGVVAFCPVLSQEWAKHASRFARKWLATMVASRKVVRINDENNVAQDVDESQLVDCVKQVALKDCHLVHSAIIASAFVASRDDAAREAFKEASKCVGYIANVVWFNPVSEPQFIDTYWGGKRFVDKRFLLREE
ncbi:hypothetical protein IEI94_05290 [Halomonas sp. ML-15]|uniref:hypothetical protein n=1 Tax=Halomonas sp. ML-15 TaxID=2773305 RepID=UPI001746390C|nr:hypothetical protein [Halomonas sp. ML-15]MBD3895261.1 hypothetical protein [Halomonas sp. ML-15]